MSEGTRFVEVPADRLMALFADIGEKVSARGGSMSEGVHGHERVVDIVPVKRKLILRIYTSIAVNAKSVRGCGEDAVRIVSGYNWIGHKGREFWTSLSETRRIFRTAPTKLPHDERVTLFLERLKVAVREEYEVALQIPFCPVCTGPMQVRTGARGNFLGCCAFPACRGTRQMQEQERAG